MVDNASAYLLTITKDSDITVSVTRDADNVVVLTLTPEQIDYGVGMNLAEQDYTVHITNSVENAFTQWQRNTYTWQAYNDFSFYLGLDTTVNIQSAPTGNIGIIFHVVGNGSFDVMKNNVNVAHAYQYHDETVIFAINDEICTLSDPDPYNHFVFMATDPFTEATYNDYWCGYATSLAPDRLISNFVYDGMPEPTLPPTPTPTATPTPTPTSTPIPNSSINYNIGALIDGDNLNVHACSGSARGYFYMIAPDNQNKYATYVNEYSCTDFSIPLADMMISGGAGNWTSAIFDESDLSQSKAYFQVLISDGVTLLFTSAPTGAQVFINSSLKGTTPFNYNAGNQTYFHFKFNKSGYVDAIFDSHLTTSNTVNANLALLPPGPTPQPTITQPPGTQPGYQPIDFETQLNSFGALITDFNNALGAGTKLLLALIVIIGLTWKLRMPGLIAGVIISALFWIPIWITVLGVILIIVVVIYTRSNYYER